MGTLSASIDVEAPSGAIWDVLADVRRLPELSPDTVEVRDAPDRLGGAGETFCQVVDVGRRRHEARWTVEELVPGRRIVVSGRAPLGGRYRLTQEIAPRWPAAARVTMTVAYALPLGPLGRVAARLGVDDRVRSELDDVLGNLRRVVERKVRPPAPGSDLIPRAQPAR